MDGIGATGGCGAFGMYGKGGGAFYVGGGFAGAFRPCGRCFLHPRAGRNMQVASKTWQATGSQNIQGCQQAHSE